MQAVSTRDSGGLHVSVYGHPKTGKTRLLATFPKPVAIIGAEDGTKSIRGVDGVDFVRVILNTQKPPKTGSYVRLHEVGSLVAELVDSHYATLGVDTASNLAELLLADILGLDDVPTQKSWGMASRAQYGQQSLKLRTILRDVLRHSANVVIVAHERNFGEDNEDSDLILPVVGSAISKNSCTWLNGQVDYVCQTFKREQVIRKPVKLSTGKVKHREERTGKTEYCLRVDVHPVYMTGFRCPVGTVLPDAIVDPTYEKIAKLAGVL